MWYRKVGKFVDGSNYVGILVTSASIDIKSSVCLRSMVLSLSGREHISRRYYMVGLISGAQSKRYCSKSVSLKKELPKVIKRCPKPCCTIPFIRKNRFIPFDSVRLATLRFELLWHRKRMTLQNFFQNALRDIRLLSKEILQIGNCLLISNAMFDYFTLF